MTNSPCSVNLKLISEDAELQMRAATSPEVVAEYRRLLNEAMEACDSRFQPEWPFSAPVTLYNVHSDDGLYLIADGFHRVQAARDAGWEWVTASVIVGTIEDARLSAIKSNAGHGLPRSQADRRKAVRAALIHPSLKDAGNRDIARVCGVSHGLVAAVRLEPAEQSEVVKLPGSDPAARQQAGVRVNFPQGRTADIGGKQVGLSRRTAERLAEVLDVIDSAEASGDTATATRLLDDLENDTAAVAHRAAVAAKPQTSSQENPSKPVNEEPESREWTKDDARKFNASFTSIMRAIDRGKNLEQLTIIEHRDFMNTIQDFGDKWQDLFPQMEWI